MGGLKEKARGQQIRPTMCNIGQLTFHLTLFRLDLIVQVDVFQVLLNDHREHRDQQPGGGHRHGPARHEREGGGNKEEDQELAN